MQRREFHPSRWGPIGLAYRRRGYCSFGGVALLGVLVYAGRTPGRLLDDLRLVGLGESSPIVSPQRADRFYAIQHARLAVRHSRHRRPESVFFARAPGRSVLGPADAHSTRFTPTANPRVARWWRIRLLAAPDRHPLRRMVVGHGSRCSARTLAQVLFIAVGFAILLAGSKTCHPGIRPELSRGASL